jgi:hypothetical protein
MEGAIIEAEQVGIVINENQNTGDIIANKSEINEQNIYFGYGPQEILKNRIVNFDNAIDITKIYLSSIQEEKANLDSYLFVSYMIIFISFAWMYVAGETFKTMSAQHIVFTKYNILVVYSIPCISFIIAIGRIIYFNRKKDDNDGTKYKRWKWLSYEIKANKELMVEFYKNKVIRDINEQ